VTLKPGLRVTQDRHISIRHRWVPINVL